MEVSNSFSPLKYTLLFIILVLVQVLVCGNMLLFGVAVPFIFIFFILTLPLDTNLNLLMLSAFLLGLSVDLFSDTLGLNSMACLLLSILKKPLFYAYMPKEDKFKSARPGIASMGWVNYIKYVLSASAFFSLVVFGLEFFSFASVLRIILMAAASTLFTSVLIVAIDSLFNNR